MSFSDAVYTARIIARVAQTITKQAGGVLLGQAKVAGVALKEKAQGTVASAKSMLECLKSGHIFKFHPSEEYMGIGGKEPVYWRTCDRCSKTAVGKVVASTTTTKLWMAVYSSDKQQVEEPSLPDYQEKIKTKK